MMQQWHDCKRQAGDAILFFRLGDFYEAFYDDAERIAQDLNVTLTKRQGTPMAGVPFHAAESYIEKLVRKGHVVAIAEQLENPKNVKGIVKRAITRTVSPATLLTDSYLAEKESSYFLALSHHQATWGLARIDVSTGRFEVAEFSDEKALVDELHKSRPRELLIQERGHSLLKESLDEYKANHDVRLTLKPNWEYDDTLSFEHLTTHFGVHSLDGFGMKGMTSGTNAASVLLSFVQDERSLHLGHIRKITPLHTGTALVIDRATQRNLELVTPLHHGGTNTLFNLLDETVTPMGGRLLAELILRPLSSQELIERRLNAVEELLQTPHTTPLLIQHLSSVKDLERLTARIATGSCSPRDIGALRHSLDYLPAIEGEVATLKAPIFSDIAALLDKETPATRIAETLVDDPPLRLSDGAVIREGVHAELDEYKRLKSESQQFLAQYQETLKTTLDIKTLKVGYSKAFGYFIEVSKGQSSRMPTTFERRQTLVNAERFISPELKTFEEKILTADERISDLEATLFEALKQEVARYAENTLTIARGIAQLDCLLCFARTAQKRAFTRPSFTDSPGLSIEGGRHPIVEQTRKQHQFIPNDTTLNHDIQSMMLITGPNMAGKSTYIRQVALITIMAHMGSFVPAAQATLGIVDKVFSRIGASDDLSRGQSTFMVEMAETAHILHNATSRSLVILDEIGRGTSTYDGIAIAWAVAEYLLTAHHKPVFTLFATHYSELTTLHDSFPVAQNFQIAVEEAEGSIVFLHKIIPGGTDKSYGIHVASLAGLPKQAIACATRKLHTLEQDTPPSFVEKVQLPLFEPARKPSLVEKKLETIDPNSISPKEALEILYGLKEALQSSC